MIERSMQIFSTKCSERARGEVLTAEFWLDCQGCRAEILHIKHRTNIPKANLHMHSL